MSERGISVNELKLQLDDALSVRLASLVTEVAGSAMVQELGVSVDVGVVARIALLRGLSHLEQHGYGSTATTSAPAAVAAATPAAPAVAKSDTSDVARDGDGLIKTPEGWSAWVGTAVPESHSGVHAYYTGCGWSRWTGKAVRATSCLMAGLGVLSARRHCCSCCCLLLFAVLFPPPSSAFYLS